MDLSGGNAVDTVEVVSAGEQAMDPNEENAGVTINVVSSHSGVPIPSSGVSCTIFLGKIHSG